MFEKDETDFEIFLNEKEKTFSLYVGTWSIDKQSLADVIFFLSLNKKIIKDKTDFFKKLNSFNDLFINNKDLIIKDIKKNKLNMLNSVLNENEIYEILQEYEYNEKQDGFLKENETYNFNFKKCETYLETTYLNQIIETIKDTKNIKQLYEGLQEIKTEMKQYIYENYFDFVYVE
jgi:hypothetical protein